MVRVGAQDFYVNELALLDDQRFTIPYMWCTYDGVLVGMCRLCEVNPVCQTASISLRQLISPEQQTNMLEVTEHTARIAATSFARSLPDLQAGGEVPVFERTVSVSIAGSLSADGFCS